MEHSPQDSARDSCFENHVSNSTVPSTRLRMLSFLTPTLSVRQLISFTFTSHIWPQGEICNLLIKRYQ